MATFAPHHGDVPPHDEAPRRACDEEVLAMVEDQVGTTAAGLRRAARRRDPDEVRAFAYELIVLAGSAIAAVPRD
jgi:hypothetical protein